MADYVEKYSSKASDELEKRIKRVYKQAAEEVRKKLDDFISGHKARNAKMLQMVADGQLSEQDYQKWMRGQVFQGDQWKQKLKDVTEVYVHADEKAREIVGGTSKNVFMEAANYTAYDLEKGLRGAVAFNVYDAKTVERLLRKDPKMLPEWKIDQPKDYTWNEKRVRNAVAQGIIQGESIGEIGDRLTGELATSNVKKMDMFARTAVNGAQNAGRMDRLHEAEDMGIEVKKKWLATLDKRTRDTHQALDGQEQPIDEPFVVDGMKIDYPGDPLAPPELVYNCFVGETSAYTNCEIERSYCHEYKGELIEIETSCGVKFTCTPNHPILTLGGWVSAASLHNGDDLLVTKVGNRLGFGRNCNVKHVLSCMKTFHDSFKGSGLVSRNSTLSVNFHGDIPTSEVEIITKKRFLPDNRNPGISERIKKFLFELPYKAFACKCSFMKHLWRIGFSTFSFICGKCKSFPLFWGRFGHSQKHGLRPIALFNLGGVQPLNDNVAGNIQIISNCLDGFTGIVLADNIISVNKCSGRAHVYNLQTENGYYFVNTIITKSAGKRNGFAAISHNCRCTLTYVYPKYQHLQHNHERRDQLNDKNIENMTYYQWLGLEGRKPKEQEKTFDPSSVKIPHSKLHPDISYASNYFSGVVDEDNDYRERIKGKEYELKDVVISDLYTDQNTNKVENIRKMLGANVKEPVVVVHVDGKDILLDGNTRSAAASLRNEKTIKAKYYDLDSQKQNNQEVEPSDVNYQYHATTSRAITGIAEKGLQPNSGHVGKGVYFADNVKDALEWVDTTSTGGKTVLRVSEEYLEKGKLEKYSASETGYGLAESVYDGKIPLEHIQIKVNDNGDEDDWWSLAQYLKNHKSQYNMLDSKTKKKVDKIVDEEFDKYMEKRKRKESKSHNKKSK